MMFFILLFILYLYSKLTLQISHFNSTIVDLVAVFLRGFLSLVCLLWDYEGSKAIQFMLLFYVNMFYNKTSMCFCVWQAQMLQLSCLWFIKNNGLFLSFIVFPQEFYLILAFKRIILYFKHIIPFTNCLVWQPDSTWG